MRSPIQRMLMPDATANIWLADEPDSHERSWTKAKPRRLPRAASRPQTKGAAKEKNLVFVTRRSSSPHTVSPCGQRGIISQPRTAARPRKKEQKTGLTQSALSYMTCPPPCPCASMALFAGCAEDAHGSPRRQQAAPKDGLLRAALHWLTAASADRPHDPTRGAACLQVRLPMLPTGLFPATEQHCFR